MTLITYDVPTVGTKMPVDYAAYLLASSPPASSFELINFNLPSEWAGINNTATVPPGPSLRDRRLKEPLKSIIISNRSDEYDSCPDSNFSSRESSRSMSPVTPPVSPGKLKKKVSFADAKGFALAHVRIITEPSDMPPRLNSSILSSLTNGAQAGVVGQPPFRLNFDQPASDYMAFRDKLDSNCVSLENVILKDFDITGTVKVKNLAFEKSVILRWSCDAWDSHSDVQCNYTASPGGCDGNPYDTFTFRFSVPTNLSQDKKVEFAICYDVKSRQFWDNNNGKNYEILPLHYKEKTIQEVNTTDSLDFRLISSWTEYGCWKHVDTSQPYW